MGISIWRNGSCLDVDDAWCLIWDCTREEARRGEWLECIHPDDRSLGISLILAQNATNPLRLMEARSGTLRCHGATTRPPERFRQVHCTSITLHVVDSDPIVIRLDQPLTDSPGMPADDTSASIDEWAAAFAHGINNPLAVIDSEVGLILDVLSSGDDPSATVSGTELAETGREIRHQIRRCTRATAALQSVFRRRAPRFQPTSLYALLERFEREWPDRANLAGVTISVSLSDPLMNIKTDPWLLEQALMTAVGLVLEVCEECVPVDMMIGQGLSPDGLLILVRAGAVQDASQRKSAEMKMLRLKLDNSGKAVVEAMNAFVNRLGGSWSIEGKQGQWAEVRFTLCEPAGLDDPSAVED